jgi:hypothetical protein
MITKAPPAAPLNLTTAAQIVRAASPAGTPCLLTISGASSLELALLNITATGFCTPNQAGMLTLMLYGQPNIPHAVPPGTAPGTGWVLMAETPPEPVGGATDPHTTQWMIQGTRLMFFLDRGEAGGGKMQGEALSNIADHPEPAANLTNALTGLLPNIDPVAVFAIGALFTPDVPPIGAAPVFQMTSFTLSDGA